LLLLIDDYGFCLKKITLFNLFFRVCVDEGIKMVMKMMKRMREEDEESWKKNGGDGAQLDIVHKHDHMVVFS